MAAPCPYPLLCQPLLIPKVWGGRRLESVLHKDLPADECIGESWEAADLREGASKVANGQLAQLTLTEVVDRCPDWLVGAPGERFPLLVKFIDAKQDLSVQVHPDAAICRRHYPDAASKDETWIVVHVDPGARLCCGLKEEVSVTDVMAHADDGTVSDLLHEVDVQPGDAIRIPPGTVHALGAGVMVLEIQEPSDTTFRIHDYGRGRPLHLQEAGLAIRPGHASLLRPDAEATDWGWRETVVSAPRYRIERWSVGKSMRLHRDGGDPLVLVTLQGTCAATGEACEVVMTAGDTVIVPAALTDLQLTPDGTATVVAASPCCGKPGEGDEP